MRKKDYEEAYADALAQLRLKAHFPGINYKGYTQNDVQALLDTKISHDALWTRAQAGDAAADYALRY